MLNELALTESPSLRAQYAGHVDVLDKVKAVRLLPDDIHLTREMVANYYEVDLEAIKSLDRRNRTELEENGMRVLKGASLREFEGVNLTPSPNRRSLALFTRRTLLNVGEMLTGSEVAKAIRKHLLDVEEDARRQQSAAPAVKAAPSFIPTTYPYEEAVVLIRQKFGIRVPVVELTRILRLGGILRQNGKPKADYEALFWHTGTAYEVFGHSIEPLYRLYESTKIRLEMAAQSQVAVESMGWPELPLGSES